MLLIVQYILFTALYLIALMFLLCNAIQISDMRVGRGEPFGANFAEIVFWVLAITVGSLIIIPCTLSFILFGLCEFLIGKYSARTGRSKAVNKDIS